MCVCVCVTPQMATDHLKEKGAFHLYVLLRLRANCIFLGIFIHLLCHVCSYKVSTRIYQPKRGDITQIVPLVLLEKKMKDIPLCKPCSVLKKYSLFLRLKDSMRAIKSNLLIIGNINHVHTYYIFNAPNGSMLNNSWTNLVHRDKTFNINLLIYVLYMCIFFFKSAVSV